MDIKRISDSQIRCAITEEEIVEMGFDIDEIIGNTDETQKFMGVLLDKIKEQEAIDVELLSPMVRAELLPDHSMTVTFGGITEEDKKTMLDKVLEMMDRLSAKVGAVGEMADDLKKAQAERAEKLQSVVDEAMSEMEQEIASEDIFTEPTPFALEFERMEAAIRVSRLFCGKEEVPPSELFKLNEKYYLLMDLQYLSKMGLRPFALAAVEYHTRHIATKAGIAFIREHGRCIIGAYAIEALMQL